MPPRLNERYPSPKRALNTFDMKTQNILLRVLALLTIGFSVLAVQAHDSKKKVAGPNGGRVIAGIEPRAEFFVLPDRKVQITFLDQAGKPIPPANQVVTIIAGERMSPTSLTFSRAGNKLISNVPLPPGADIPAVVQIKSAPNVKGITEKINVDLAKCGECKLAEYACICAH
jgi:hypothetical protein